MPIGDRIRALRKARGLNQTELGKRLGVKTNAVSKWECGRVEDIPMSKVKAMAALFDVPVSYLIDDDTPKLLPKNEEWTRVDNLIKKILNWKTTPEYSLLTDEDVQMILAFADMMAKRHKSETALQDTPKEETTE